MRYFEYRNLISFEETNVVGNVYFSNYFVWQGKCREYFLAEYAPKILEDFKAGFGMITKDSACEFHNEAFAFERLLIRMSLEKLMRTGMVMAFDYYREEEAGETLLAQGRQTALWISPEHKVCIMPSYLYDAVNEFASGEAA